MMIVAVGAEWEQLPKEYLAALKERMSDAGTAGPFLDARVLTRKNKALFLFKLSVPVNFLAFTAFLAVIMAITPWLWVRAIAGVVLGVVFLLWFMTTRTFWAAMVRRGCRKNGVALPRVFSAEEWLWRR